ncbi:alpha/beta hydrolase domain-containing protein [Amycolatopsis sp. RTGN1]|uniref:alpha/beta hydrolase domain-containing protein n=1 Tax=Amycolatopsis ponsaeliensis TaxID=2992142 RepID=UPI00254C2FFC|nr:alpha/beta hydrolase domain-containing protein [Amycolatopsis sp. RTGN1]
MSPSEPRSTVSRRSALIASSGLALTALAASPAEATGRPERGAKVPTPSVTGPVPSRGGRDHPFLATDVDLAGRGYALEEFFYSGKANSYDIPIPTVLNDPPLPTVGKAVSSHPYTTRLVVHRPTDPARFSGTVFVEWTNTTPDYEFPIWWLQNHEFMLREGHGYVGVAANHWAVHAPQDGLKVWNPERYAALDFPLVLLSDPEPDPWRHDDQLSYDVFAQGMKAVRAVPRIMGGLPVRHVIAGGHSRSAVHLGVYLNAVHPHAPVADGVMPIIAGRQVRSDLDIPVLKVLSETDFVAMYDEWTQLTARQPDTDRFRTWWMSGTTHVDHHMALARAATQVRDLPDRPLEGTDCDPPGLSRVQSQHVVSAAMAAMVRWVTGGKPPAHSPLPEFTATPPALVRDEHDNARGGIRLATFAVPVATDRGTTTCDNNLVGTHVPFDDATLRKLYPSHEDYVGAVTAALFRNVRDGFLLHEDATDLATQARASIVGKGLVTGPLVGNVADFRRALSIPILRDHTQTYHFRDGERLLGLLDQAVTAAAEGYTTARRKPFDRAIGLVRQYRDLVAAMPDRSRTIADLLVRFAGTLIDELTAERDRH